MLHPTHHAFKPVTPTEQALCALFVIVLPVALGIGLALAF